MPVTSLRKTSARPPEVAKIKIKIKSRAEQSKSKKEQEQEPGTCLGFRLLHFECTVIATNRITTGLTINTQTNATGIANW